MHVGPGGCIRTLELPVGTLEAPNVFTPDDVAAGTHIEGPIVVFDYDNYYMGGALAEFLAQAAGSRHLCDSGRPRLRVDHHDQ